METATTINKQGTDLDLSELHEWLQSPYIKENFAFEMEAAYDMLLDEILADPTTNGSPELCQMMSVFRGFVRIAKRIKQVSER